MIILSKTDEVPRDYFLDFLRARAKEGIKVEKPVNEYEDAVRRKEDALAVIKNEYGIANPNSHKQLSEYALASNDSLLLSCVMDYAGKLSFNEESIAKLLEVDHPFGAVLQRYRNATSIIKNIDMIMSCVDSRGLVHPIVSLQNTNRISYTQPALMNINKKILWKMIKPFEGYELWSMDVKNQEPWIFAHLVGDKELTNLVQEAYMRKESFYKVVFEHVYGRPVTNDYEYKEFKVGWNMLTYGGTKEGLLAVCKSIDGNKLYKFFSGLPAYKEYTAKNRRLAYHKVNTLSTYFGSTVVSDKVGVNALARSLADIGIQGTGADILALLVKNINMNIMDSPELRDKVSIYYTRHDEIIFQVKRDAGETDEDIEKILRELCDHMIDVWVPFMIDVEKIS